MKGCYSIIILFIIIFNLSCVSIKKTASIEDSIYSFIIKNDIFSSHNSDSINSVYVYNRTIYTELGLFKNPIKSYLNDTVFFYLLENFKCVNSKENVIKPTLRINNDRIKIKLLEKDKFNSISKSKSDSLVKTSTLGLIKFSKPVFTKDYNFAFIYRTLTLSPLSGRGDFFILIKYRVEWKIIYQKTLWVS